MSDTTVFFSALRTKKLWFFVFFLYVVPALCTAIYIFRENRLIGDFSSFEAYVEFFDIFILLLMYLLPFAVLFFFCGAV